MLNFQSVKNPKTVSETSTLASCHHGITGLSDFNINFESQKEFFLGKGSFASVFKSVNAKDGKSYALKIVA